MPGYKIIIDYIFGIFKDQRSFIFEGIRSFHKLFEKNNLSFFVFLT